MKILIIGFQRSGTTLMRRIIDGHPEVKKIFHENFLLRKYQTKEALMMAIERTRFDPINDNWGEKTPFYPTIRRIPVLKYCNTWNEYFGDESRILHIVRHPVDVASSILKKRKRGIIGSLNLYCNNMVTIIPGVKKIKNTFTFKYEDMLLNPDEILPNIFEFCGLRSDINFRQYLKKIKKTKYQTLDASRVFAYKNKNVIIKQDLREVIKIANKIDGPKYLEGVRDNKNGCDYV